MSGYGKKGYIRTIEAIIAIVLILLFTYQVIPRTTQQGSKTPEIVEDSQNFIIQELSTNDTLRDCIINHNPPSNPCEKVASVIEENLPAGYSYTYKICEETSGCLAIEETPTDRSVYVKSLFIASTLEQRKPKIVKIFFWAS